MTTRSCRPIFKWGAWIIKKKEFILSALAIWLICACSLLAVRYLSHRRPNTPRFATEAKGIYADLESLSKQKIALYESAILKLGDDSVHLVGSGFEFELESLISDKKLSVRKIDFVIEDPLLLERRIMVGEAFKTLNNAEKRCLIDGFASILFRNGFYQLIYDPIKYKDYVLKYGTECKSCEEIKKSVNKRGRHE